VQAAGSGGNKRPTGSRARWLDKRQQLRWGGERVEQRVAARYGGRSRRSEETHLERYPEWERGGKGGGGRAARMGRNPCVGLGWRPYEDEGLGFPGRRPSSCRSLILSTPRRVNQYARNCPPSRLSFLSIPAPLSSRAFLASRNLDLSFVDTRNATVLVISPYRVFPEPTRPCPSHIAHRLGVCASNLSIHPPSAHY